MEEGRVAFYVEAAHRHRRTSSTKSNCRRLTVWAGRVDAAPRPSTPYTTSATSLAHASFGSGSRRSSRATVAVMGFFERRRIQGSARSPDS